jgi:phosphatidylserine/phosphatidylglycerophosphate/cardiolipin synthase-like enzyme
MFKSSGLRHAVLWSCLALSGCATLPRHVDKIQSHALQNPQSTTLGRIVESSGGGSALSGVRLLSQGDEALASLITLADHAERTLDIQYYIIDRDESARVLLHHVRLAAERGVRVRLLVDDLNTAGMDRRFMKLGERTNIQVRVFNPFPGGRFAMWTRFLESASDIPRINHRMHNKLMVADNALAVTGGRNIGDQYFTRGKAANFIDLDVVAAGPIVQQLSASFDAFWNSRYAYPLSSLASPVDTEPAPAVDESDFPADARFLARDLDAGRLQLTWVPATVLADRPAKIADESRPDQTDTVADDIATLMRSAQSEVIVISPYFVPGKEGMALFAELAGRGVHIRILTNSLASTDSPLVDTGYARYRVALLKLGVELSEVRPKLGTKRIRFHPFRSSTASLHAKSLVIDQKTVFIGSMNMDARSARTNCELGLVIRSPELARQVTALLDDMRADGSYRLELEDHTDHILWRSGEPGAERVWHTDPETTLLQRLTLGILAPFAPEELL